MLNYRCLVLDHDDTVVQSAETVNYPSFLEVLRVLRPGLSLSLHEFTQWCFADGFSALCDHVGFTEAEMQTQYRMWKEYSATHLPPPYPGLKEVLTRFRREGGLVCVSSHSAQKTILRDYQRHFGFVPDQIFDWELGEGRRKPAPYALEEIMRRYNLLPDQLLMVDDLKPGCDMARACGVPFACAGWSHQYPEIIDFMRQCSDVYLQSPADLENCLFGA